LGISFVGGRNRSHTNSTACEIMKVIFHAVFYYYLVFINHKEDILPLNPPRTKIIPSKTTAAKLLRGVDISEICCQSEEQDGLYRSPGIHKTTILINRYKLMNINYKNKKLCQNKIMKMTYFEIDKPVFLVTMVLNV
jgi:hypothetical protein